MFKALQSEVIGLATSQSKAKAKDNPISTYRETFKDKITFKAMDKLVEEFKITVRRVFQNKGPC